MVLPRQSRRLHGQQPELDVQLDGDPHAAPCAMGLQHALSGQTISNPQSYQEARNLGEWSHWKHTMDAEMGKMKIEYKVYVPMGLACGHRYP